MKIDVLSLFPEMITSYCEASILGIAQDKGLIKVEAHNPRDYTENKHNCVDDLPYGGGPGMVLSPQPFYDCFEAVSKDIDLEQAEVIITAPSGRKFDQELAKELSKKKNLVIFCGRYEGFDERIKSLATMEISLGDYVLTGGELAALTIIDSTTRLLPGVLGDDESSLAESFSIKNYLEENNFTKRELEGLLERTGLKKNDLNNLQLLEHPQYTRPPEFKGQKVPEVLQSGDHKKISLWRLEEAIKITRQRRPDLLDI